MARRNIERATMTRSQFIRTILVLCSALALVQGAIAKGNDLRDLRRSWVGEYPSTRKQNLLNEPRLKGKLKALLGEERYKQLLSDDYLQIPIDYVEGYFVLSYAANLHIMPKAEQVYIIIREHTGSLHVAIQDDRNKIQWMHSDEPEIPFKILEMLSFK
ncbi:hypothetical protein [Geomonas propionica]|uniref:Uncharacterized protein n=1 Tax=Geomonas propionica TaxID=2798582 RepID=A0ABS0YXJ7_9BACT|nr:hypothetical protein [Geomonas propionica]MBJ6802678.1 hypothetical protein [Geomonas propionica]